MKYQFSVQSSGGLGYEEEQSLSNNIIRIYAVEGSGQLYTTLPDLWKIRFETEEQFEKIKHYFATRNNMFSEYIYIFTGPDRAFTSDFKYIADIDFSEYVEISFEMFSDFILIHEPFY